MKELWLTLIANSLSFGILGRANLTIMRMILGEVIELTHMRTSVWEKQLWPSLKVFSKSLEVGSKNYFLKTVMT